MKFVAYYRVSTRQQGESGLGLEDQQLAVTRYLGERHLLASFTEVETGRSKKALALRDRPELKAALELCRRQRATLLIATLDRLARSVAFIASLMETGVPFTAVDSPNDTPLMLHVKAAFAEEEGRKISERTRRALAVAKLRGTRLGNPRIETAVAPGCKANAAKAGQFAENLLPLLRDIQKAGATTLQSMADALNARGIISARGGLWYPSTVRNILRRAPEEARQLGEKQA